MNRPNSRLENWINNLFFRVEQNPWPNYYPTEGDKNKPAQVLKTQSQTPTVRYNLPRITKETVFYPAYAKKN